MQPQPGRLQLVGAEQFAERVESEERRHGLCAQVDADELLRQPSAQQVFAHRGKQRLSEQSVSHRILSKVEEGVERESRRGTGLGGARIR